MEDTRVGYATINALVNITDDYIKVHVEDHKYTGKLQYLINQKVMTDYLKK